ncbi:MAG: hypothetical protein IJP89_08630 [Synergistaceae bacterium]|nr:hypothetical protein [Synergistaceae bacterium]MBR0258281.1 hypothetical protein [Synergistaceae bacterium]
MSVEILRRLFKVVIDEAENNPDFSAKIEQILSSQAPVKKQSTAKKPSNRRDAPALDPVKALAEGEASLREKLGGLTEKQLKDIIAYYGMDSSKQAMRWKKTDRLIDLIAEESKRISKRGDAFRH